MVKKYLKIWWILTIGTTQVAFASRFGASVFIIGKLLRFFFFLLFLILLVSKTRVIAGYSFWQVIFFYASFNLVDTLPQFFLREVYRFRWQVLSGYFDHILVKPMSALFKALFGGSDIFDLSILSLSGFFIIFSAGKIGEITTDGVLLYMLLIANAFVITLAFHIFVLGIGILTTEVDNTIMLYRDLTQMGRVPVDVYTEPIRGLLTFAIPVGIMMTFPPKVLMGLLSPTNIILAVFLGILFIVFSLKFWEFSLRHYASASS